MSSRTSAPPDLLEAIVAATRARVAAQQEREPIAVIERRAAARTPNGAAFRAALADRNRTNVIAECKRRSPSRGVLRHDYDPVAIARGYEKAGAAALSVLTEPMFFDGSLDHLAQVRQAVDVPLLRKDFIVDAYQLFEARAGGADAVLLIVAALDDDTLAHLRARAGELGLAVLVEVHDAGEVARARAAGADIIGVNNRNLKTFNVDIQTSHRLAKLIPEDRIFVVESGIRDRKDIDSLLEAGADAFLIGETLIVSPNPGASLRSLL
jgi:indole-3-glycerol phosphate synthase